MQLYLDLVKEEYARNLTHMWHEPLRVDALGEDCALQLIITGKPNGLFPVVHVSTLKQNDDIP